MKTATIIQFHQPKCEHRSLNTCDRLAQDIMTRHRHAPVILVGMAIGSGIRAIQHGKEYPEAHGIAENMLRNLIIQNLDPANRERFLRYRYKLNRLSTNNESEE